MFVFKKRSPRRTLNDLETYLMLHGSEPARLLARKIMSWGEFSYAELEAAIEDGRLNELLDWQQRYSTVVNEHMAPLWLSAIQAAAKKSSKGKILLSDSEVDVNEWIKNHGGEFVTNLSAESKRAIANILLKWQGEDLNPRKMAQQIRPLIGLTSRQMTAVDNYRRVAGDKAALRYASRQHRFRADTIIHTELAFAYNQGAHVGVIRSISQGYMSHCAMIWTTAGTNRVCSRCLELKDKVVGYTNQEGVTLPPLHPRCRCAIQYKETNEKITGNKFKPLTPERAKAIKDAEDAAYNARTEANFGFKRSPRAVQWAEAVRLANGDGGGVERMINCQRCVVAHEVRMRGYDVTARPGWGTADPLLKIADWLEVFEKDSREIYNCVGELEEFIAARMKEWGKGSRAFVWFKWASAIKRDDFGHVIVTRLNENGFVQYGDPQKRKIGAVKYLNETEPGTVVIMRADTLKFTDAVKRCCLSGGQTI